ncbi:hypothetical protein SPC_1270 [Salmonella enterica subsp. enterica serovar Paratyphi C str. RKS4594]|uniref:Uncharacterized protein n=1 Tax=Salmonella paratyphi C (strain RKS4594) TaxID=476213 RepID=C0PZF0_SALPC|nr:hypothetical protein SPC_1270 [Salmonella enterica subsp. enterica serovar Paratyphi C str. RKS4594]
MRTASWFETNYIPIIGFNYLLENPSFFIVVNVANEVFI